MSSPQKDKGIDSERGRTTHRDESPHGREGHRGPNPRRGGLPYTDHYSSRENRFSSRGRSSPRGRQLFDSQSNQYRGRANDSRTDRNQSRSPPRSIHSYTGSPLPFPQTYRFRSPDRSLAQWLQPLAQSSRKNQNRSQSPLPSSPCDGRDPGRGLDIRPEHSSPLSLHDPSRNSSSSSNAMSLYPPHAASSQNSLAISAKTTSSLPVSNNESFLSARKPSIKNSDSTTSSKKVVQFAAVDPLKNHPKPVLSINEVGQNLQFLKNQDCTSFPFYCHKKNAENKAIRITTAFEQPGCKRIWLYVQKEWKRFDYDIPKLRQTSKAIEAVLDKHSESPLYCLAHELCFPDARAFAIFLGWVASNTFETSQYMIKVPQNLKSKEASSEIRDRYYLLVMLYAVGEIYLVDKFKDAIMDALCSTAKLYADVRKSVPGYNAEIIRDLIFNREKIVEISILRRFTLDVFLSSLNVKDWPGDFFEPSGPGKEFFTEYNIHATKAARKNEAACAPWDRPKCYYHMHLKGEVCSTGAVAAEEIKPEGNDGLGSK